ncbi:Uncharacterized protein TCM_025175 [Theobroma cacao]|uniref:Reverse transcriptase zinc-binding domain-containing protein n=1 Tax=Theobroma cacao TaxID=3641 RepID=A0A061EYR6_THECC|nr:Uncharacterized protein TCM_025175 [Theobroma cacao]
MILCSESSSMTPYLRSEFLRLLLILLYGVGVAVVLIFYGRAPYRTVLLPLEEFDKVIHSPRVCCIMCGEINPWNVDHNVINSLPKVSRPQALWVRLIWAKYDYGRYTCLNKLRRLGSSSFWSAIGDVWNAFKTNVRWAIGNEKTIWFWMDLWLRDQTLTDIDRSRGFIFQNNSLVKDFVMADGERDFNILNYYLPPKELTLLSETIVPQHSSTQDMWYWAIYNFFSYELLRKQKNFNSTNVFGIWRLIYTLIAAIQEERLINVDNGRDSSAFKEEVFISWRAPEVDWISLNTNGACQASTEQSAAGGVLRDSPSHWKSGFAMRLRKCTAYQAKLGGFRKIVL